MSIEDSSEKLTDCSVGRGVQCHCLGAFSLWQSLVVDYWFVYEQTAQKTVKEPYEHVLDMVETKACYTTTYGECYHVDYCGCLHSSKYEATIYEALQDG